MGKDPAVLFYTSDFISGTLLMTNEQAGIYIRLLCLQHQIYPEHIPENHMISVCFSHDSPVIKKFIKDSDGCYYNKRMEEEIIKRVSYCNSRSNNKSGRKPKKSYDKSYDNHMNLHMENENENRNDIINNSLEELRETFLKEVMSFTQYPKEMLESFFKYWTELNSSGKMRFQSQEFWEYDKRLERWKNGEENKNVQKNDNVTW